MKAGSEEEEELERGRGGFEVFSSSSSFLLLLLRSGSKGGMTLPCTFTLLPSTEQSGREDGKVVVVVYIASSATFQAVYLLARTPAPRNYLKLRKFVDEIPFLFSQGLGSV